MLARSWRSYMGQCVSRKAGAVIAASGHHDSPSYRIMEKSAKIQVKAPRFYSFCFSLFFQTIIKIFQYRITMMYILTINNRKLIINFFLLPLESFLYYRTIIVLRSHSQFLYLLSLSLSLDYFVDLKLRSSTPREDFSYIAFARSARDR